MSKKGHLLRNMQHKRKVFEDVVLKGEKLDFCLEALQKQVAKKVRRKDFEIGYPKYYCPICHKQQKETKKNKTKGCYCERCGQKLIWGGEDYED